MNCLICHREGADRCHIKSRGSGGKDDWWNILYLCRSKHRLQHAKGWAWMAKEYPIIDKTLRDFGWSFLPWGKIVRDQG